ncbi:MAG: recombinase family protein, partial [Candidatus Thiodiazotropha sp.]
MKQAVIYCRISSQAQFEKGDGLESQATRCREFARFKGLEVIETFQDTKSGSLIERPGMQAMLAYLRKHRKEGLTVIIDDLSRMARGIMAHWELRKSIADAGAQLASPSIEFGEDPDSILVENLLASVNQHQREKNAEQTVNRMKARMMNGFWVHPRPPIGYRYEKSRDRGKVLVRDEPFASIIQEGLEGYASGRFQLQSELKRFFESFQAFPRDSKGEVRNQKVNDILTHVIYAGYLESKHWDISLRPAQHEGLISLEIWQKNQQRLNKAAYVPARKNLNKDFPLRGFIACGECGHPMTACWSKGRNGHHPYYMCFKKGCASYRKSIKRDTLEGEFEALLKTLQPTKGLVELAGRMFKELWDHRLRGQQAHKQGLKNDVQNITRQIDQLLDRIVDAESPTVIAAYEKRINKLEQDKLVIAEKTATTGKPVRGFDGSFRTALDFLANPWKLWNSDRLEDKRAVLKLTFADRLGYVRNEGFRTAKTTLPFKVLGDISGPKMKMAEREGFEPSMELLTPYSLSRGAPSAARPS